MPTDTPTDTPAPTQQPTNTPEPTKEPYQRVGYGITIGDGVPVREWPSSSSSISEELGKNKIVYVVGQTYQGDVAWSMAEYDGEWGYIRADMLRMISDEEMDAYASLIQETVDPNANNTVAPYTYNGENMSCYGYVTADTVNFRTTPSTKGTRIRQLKKYALCLVYGTEESEGTTWYKVSYDSKVGYVSGDYFKQMTVGEAESFLNSTKYTEGIANNSAGGSGNNTTGNNDAGTGGNGGSNTQTTASPTGAPNAEDQKVNEWQNPNSGADVSYEPFDPFATPEPLAENQVENSEYLDSLAEQIKAGTLKIEDLKTELEKFYKDAANPDESVDKAMSYIYEKLGMATEQPSESPDPVESVTPQENPQEQSSGGGGAIWVIILVVLAAAGGGGYYWYMRTQQKRQAAQRIAQKKAAQQRSQQNAKGAKTPGNSPKETPNAQNAAKVRTGTYTDKAGTAKPRPTATGTGADQAVRKPYGKNVENPYGRYTSSSAEDDDSYTASFKPEKGKGTVNRPRKNSHVPKEPEDSWTDDTSDKWDDPES